MHLPSDVPWWRGAVFYQIYPLSFADSNGDGYGDLPGVVRQLDHVAALGAEAIWLSPVFRSPMTDWGYDVQHYTEIDPLFGSLDDFDRIVAAAHARGLRVLLDQVWCHSADSHPWFEASRRSRGGAHADWYVWADPAPDGGPPNNWLSVFGGSAWRWEPQRRQYFLHHFLPSQPKFDLRNEAVLEALLETGRFWLDRGVDGFRLDAMDFLLHDAALRSNPPKPPADGIVPLKPFGLQHHRYDMLQPDAVGIMRRIRGLLDEYPGTVALGEMSSQAGGFDRIAAATAAGGLHLGYTLSLLRGEFTADLFRRALEEAGPAVERFGVCWNFGNHDVVRAATRWGGGGPDAASRIRLAMRLFGALPGTLCLYQGDELGLTEAVLTRDALRDPFGLTYYPAFAGRDGARTPMPWRSDARDAGFGDGAPPWLPVPAAHHLLAVDLQERDPDSTLAHWRRFLAWRRTCPPLLRGRLEALAGDRSLLAFDRVLEGERVACLFNFSPDPRPLPGQRPLAPWEARFVASDGRILDEERDREAVEQA